MTYADLSPEEKQRLHDAYEAGFASGNGRPWLLTDDEETIAMIEAVAEDWWLRLETMQAARRFVDPAPEQIPGWLREHIERAEGESHDL